MAATISKGTLNLRFMQNAHRAEQQLDTNSSEPAIKDESHWEVSKEVKEMWGMTSEPLSSSSLVTHEMSYLPFVLSRIDASGSSPQPVKLRGRREWDKRGQEVTEAEQPPANDDPRGLLSSSSSSAAQQDPTAGHHRQPTTSKRLASISGFGPGGPSSSTKETARAKRAKPRNAKTAQEIIREAPPPPPPPFSSGISEIGIKPEGGDTPALPTRASQSPQSPQPSPNAIDGRINSGAPPPHPDPRNHHHHRHLPTTPLKFLKPAGVDEPSSDHVALNIKRERENRSRTSSGNGGGGGGGGALTSDRDRKRKKSGAAAAAAVA